LRIEFQINDLELFKEKVLDWLQPFDTFCFLDSNGYTDSYGKWDWIAAAGATTLIRAEQHPEVSNQLAQLDEALFTKRQWWFGHLSF
jgi:para-aminobenzoate synthetase component 1